MVQGKDQNHTGNQWHLVGQQFAQGPWGFMAEISFMLTSRIPDMLSSRRSSFVDFL